MGVGVLGLKVGGWGMGDGGWGSGVEGWGWGVGFGTSGPPKVDHSEYRALLGSGSLALAPLASAASSQLLYHD